MSPINKFLISYRRDSTSWRIFAVREDAGEETKVVHGAAGPDTRMAPLSGENFRKYSKAKSIERGVLIIINKAGV